MEDIKSEISGNSLASVLENALLQTTSDQPSPPPTTPTPSGSTPLALAATAALAAAKVSGVIPQSDCDQLERLGKYYQVEPADQRSPPSRTPTPSGATPLALATIAAFVAAGASGVIPPSPEPISDRLDWPGKYYQVDPTDQRPPPPPTPPTPSGTTPLALATTATLTAAEASGVIPEPNYDQLERLGIDYQVEPANQQSPTPPTPTPPGFTPSSPAATAAPEAVRPDGVID